MVDFYTQKIPEHWYYSNFFPERHFNTSEEAIEFEKSIVFPHFPRMFSFYERVETSTPKPWEIKASDNYQNVTNSYGFKMIPYVYKTKRVFIDIQKDIISYYYFNEDTMQYELLEQITNDGNEEYEHKIFYSVPGSVMEEICDFGLDTNNNSVADFTLIVKDTYNYFDPDWDENDNVCYYSKEQNKFYYKENTQGQTDFPDKFNNLAHPYIAHISIDENDNIICNYNGDSKNLTILEDFSDKDSVPTNNYFYCPQLTGLYSFDGKEWKLVNIIPSTDTTDATERIIKLLFIKETTAVEGYLNLNLENPKDKWYVRICRSVYNVFKTIWNGILKAGQAIGTFFKNLWNWLKGERYFGTEITFYWGENVLEIPTYKDLEDSAIAISSDKIFQSIDTPKKFWYYDNKEWKKFNCEAGNIFKTLNSKSHIVSRIKDLPKIDSQPYPYDEVRYVIQNQKIYWCTQVKGQYKWIEIPTISDAAMRLYIKDKISKEETDIKDYIFYASQEKQTYKYNRILGKWMEDTEHSSLDGLYDYADAIRQVLDYKDHIIPSAAIKEFNSQISKLNEELGYNFPTNTNTLQPQNEEDKGDWGFYYYDKVQGWITGKEANELEIL